jgi:RNA polymerase-binding transcription factor DksA
MSDRDAPVDLPVDDDPTEELRRLREATAARMDGLLRERNGIVASAELVGTDDEHDPEGATLAFEREQIAALLRAAGQRLEALDAALSRVESGTYGICVACGGSIPAGRLTARPDTTTCVACAARRGGR